MTLAFKVLRRAEHAEFVARGVFEGSDADRADGFVHLSTAEQLAGTLERHFPDRDDLVLLALDTAALGASLRWEPSRGGALFPHLYRPLRSGDVRGSARVGPFAEAIGDLPRLLASLSAPERDRDGLTRP